MCTSPVSKLIKITLIVDGEKIEGEITTGERLYNEVSRWIKFKEWHLKERGVILGIKTHVSAWDDGSIFKCVEGKNPFPSNYLHYDDYLNYI
jgi:hypothetical protein